MLILGVVFLSIWQVLLACSLIILLIIVSYFFKLNLIKVIVIASFRTVLQLSLIGLVLAWIFAREQWYEVLAILTVMTLVACFSAKDRVKKPYKGLLFDTLIAIGVSGWAVALFGVVVVLQDSTWYRPQLIIPILGLILGNALTGVSLSMSQLVESLHKERGQIDTMLSLSATPFEACRELIIRAIHQGLMPTINSMMVVGLVSLPGMMTGQILAGADPQQAVRYQIVTMFLIATGSTMGCMMACLLVYRRFFDKSWRFVIPK